MADISMCLGKNCPKKNKCHRYTAHANSYGQSYSDFENRCLKNNYEDFWDNKGFDDVIKFS